jgi:hypothetical protein
MKKGGLLAARALRGRGRTRSNTDEAVGEKCFGFLGQRKQCRARADEENWKNGKCFLCHKVLGSGTPSARMTNYILSGRLGALRSLAALLADDALRLDHAERGRKG